VRRAWPALLAAAVLAPAPAALGATARFDVPDDHGVLHSSTIAHTVFTLPPTFALAHGELENTPAIGTYELVLHPGLRDECVITLVANGIAQATRPTIRGGVFADHGLRFRIVRQGRAGTRRWFTGRANGEDVTASFEAIRHGLAPARDRWAVFQASLSHRGGISTAPSTDPDCARRQATQRSTLRHAIASMHVVRGPLARAQTSSAS
jgi:hypothetical protein